MAMQMFESAQQIVLSSLPDGLGEYERRRFYGDDLARQVFR